LSATFLKIHPAALEETEAAAGWYAQRSRRAAERFLDEIDRAVDRISQNPEQFPFYIAGTRRADPFSWVFSGFRS
jgi:plasmid stabilization system protein ParE